MIELSCERLLEESELMGQVLETSCSKESLTCMDSAVAEFREDLIEAFASHLKDNDFAEVDKLIQAYINYKDFVAKRINKET